MLKFTVDQFKRKIETVGVGLGSSNSLLVDAYTLLKVICCTHYPVSIS